MSDYSLFFRWEGCRVQSTLLHLDGDVKQVVVTFTPTNRSSILSIGEETIVFVKYRIFRTIRCYFFPTL